MTSLLRPVLSLIGSSKSVRNSILCKIFELIDNDPIDTALCSYAAENLCLFPYLYFGMWNVLDCSRSF